MSSDPVKQAFADLSIPWVSVEHEPVLTVEAGLAAVGSLDSAFAKNLFIKDKKAGLFLVTVTHNRKVDLKKLAEVGARARCQCARSPAHAPPHARPHPTPPACRRFARSSLASRRPTSASPTPPRSRSGSASSRAPSRRSP